MNSTSNQSDFIQYALPRQIEARTKVKESFSHLAVDEINWRPEPDRWSIAECLDHLIQSKSIYFTVFDQIIAGTYTMNAYQKYSPFSGLWGKSLVAQMKEKPVWKMKAPTLIRPKQKRYESSILTDFIHNSMQFDSYLTRLQFHPLGQIILTSPMSRWVTYSLQHTLQFIVEHEHRHIEQGKRLLYLIPK